MSLLVIYGLLACENGAFIDKSDAMRIISDWESGHVPDEVTHSLFNEVSYNLKYYQPKYVKKLKRLFIVYIYNQ